MNHVFFLAGTLATVLEELSHSPNKTVKDTLFPLQFAPNEEEPMHYQLRSHENWKKRALYEKGLKCLQTIKPELQFLTREAWLNEKAKSEQKSPSWPCVLL